MGRLPPREQHLRGERDNARTGGIRGSVAGVSRTVPPSLPRSRPTSVPHADADGQQVHAVGGLASVQPFDAVERHQRGDIVAVQRREQF
jgi:hypothetical protein